MWNMQQDLSKLKETKVKLQCQFGREPTFSEWADGVGLSRRVLQSRLHSGNKSKDKLIRANLRLVLHIAKTYQGRGLNLQDLLQVSVTTKISLYFISNPYIWS